MKWHKIEEELPESEFVMAIKLGGKKLCLVRHEQELFAVQNTCPHAGGILSGGWCKNGHLVCPIHRWEYNLKNGRGATGQGDYIDTYPIELRSDGVYIGFKESFWKKLWS
jgi:nitrite reductase/ring-hydroxylating ferredoxin subunit